MTDTLPAKHFQTAAPVAVGTANTKGTSSALSLSDHIHAHGSQTDPTLHALATSLAHGFLSSSDFQKLASIASGATNNPWSDSVPYAVTQTGSAGTFTTAARGDHAHAHGQQPIGDGLNHALATASFAGFLSTAQFTKLAALSFGTTSGTYAEGSDSRFTNARTPTAHASSHQHGGTDEVATATAGANAIPKAGAAGTLAIGWIPTGTSGTTVALGNDARFTDARTPTVHSTSHKPGGTDEIAVSIAAINSIPKTTGASTTLAIGWLPVGTVANTVAAGDDSRFTNSRTPTAHATSHQNGGADEVGTATPTANAIPKATAAGTFAIGWLPLGTTATTVAVGNDSRLSDARTPTAHAASHKFGGSDALATTTPAVASVPQTAAGSTTLAIGWIPVGTAVGTVAAGDDSRLTNARTPTTHASTHQNGGADEIATAVAAANAIPKAGAGGTLAIGWLPLGTTATTVTAGNDSRLSDARTPVAHATTHKPGGTDEVGVAVAAINSIPKTSAVSSTLAIGWIPVGTAASTVAAGDDSRLTNARTPTAHAATHQHGGSDEIATATAAANAIPKAGAGGTLAYGWIPVGTAINTIAAGDDSRFTNSRTPTAHASTHKEGGSDALATSTPAISSVPQTTAGSSTLAIGWIPLGASASTVTVGNDSRLSDARTPVTHASTHKAGGADTVGTITPAINAIPQTNGTVATLAIGWLPVGTTTGTVAAGDDIRFTNARTPTAHAATHQHGGADEIATATAAANAIPKAGAGSTLAVGWIPFASATPSPVGTATVGTTATGAARGDHAHAHGAQTADGTLHAVTNGVNAGFYPIADFTKLAGVASGADVTLSALAVAAGTVTINNQRIAGVLDPVNPQDVATKAYVDAVAQGLDVKPSVRLIQTASMPLSGVGQVIDTKTVVAGNRVLYAFPGASAGIYIAAAGAWTRSSDANSSAEVTSGLFTFVEEGALNGQQGWVLATPDPIVLDTTSLTFTQFSGTGLILAGTGLTKTGNTINVIANADGSIVANADDIQVGIINDTQHGTRAGGTTHALATASVHGFLSSTDFSKLAALAFGTTVGTYAQGNDARFTDARTPTAHAATHKHGGTDEIAVAVATANGIPKAGAGGTLAVGWIPVGTITGTVAAGDDSRLTNARAPTSHASSHQHGGTDEVAVAVAAANAIPKAGAGGTLAVGWIPVGTVTGTVAAGDDVRFTNARTPTTHAATHKEGAADALATSTPAVSSVPQTSAVSSTLAIGWIPLGTTATTVTVGNDSRLSDARTPTTHGATHKAGGADSVGTITPAINAIPQTNGTVATLAIGWLPVGTAAGTVAAGDDTRLTNARTPTVHAATHQHGGLDEVATATAAANAIPKAGAGGNLAIGWLPLGTSATTVTVGNDARLSDARTPTAHTTSHKPGGTDEIAVSVAAINSIPKTTGSSSTLAIGWIPVGAIAGTVAAGDDTRFTNARTPTAHASSHQHGGSDEVATATAGANAIPKAGAGGTLAVGWIPVGTATGTVAAGDDSRFTNARTPTAHAASHKEGGSDALSTSTPAVSSVPQTGSGSSTLAIGWIPLGTSATTVAVGNDSRLSDARTPVSHAASHKAGGADTVGTITPAINAIPQTTGSSTSLAIGWIPVGTATGTVAAGDDSRLTNARVPTVHASSHQHGGSDEVATATPAANAIPKADASNKLALAWLPTGQTSTTVPLGNDARFTDSRTPLTHAASHKAGGADTVGTITPAINSIPQTTGSSTTLAVGWLPVGTTTGTVAAGDDSRFTDSRVPTGAAGGDLSGTYPNPTVTAASSLKAAGFASATPAAVGVAAVGTTASGAARGDHVHAHGAQAADGTLHAVASGTQAGFLSTTDFTKLAGITALADPTIATLAAASAAVSINGQRLASVGTPVNDTDAATKAYVDAIAQGLDVKASCRLATTTGVGNGIGGGSPASIVGCPSVVDGQTVALNNRILVKNGGAGSSDAYNGIYTVTTVGTGANGTWTRASDADTSAKVTSGLFTFISEGTNAGSGWVLNTPDPITLNTTNLSFTQFSGAGQINAGTGLTKTGNALNVIANADGSIVANADDIQVGVISDTQHGTRAGGTTHALATASVSGFLSSTDFQKLAALVFGSTSGTYAQGNDTRFTDARTPTAHSTSHKHGGTDEIAVAAATANGIPKAGAGGTLAVGWLPVGTATGTVAAGDDSRFTNARTPTVHASTHKEGGSDALSTSTPAVSSVPQTTAGSSTLAIGWIPLGTSATTVTVGNDSRLSDARTPLTHAATHKAGGSDTVGTITPAINSIPQTNGTVATLAVGWLPVGTATGTVAAGDDSRFTNARVPTAHASSHQNGGADEIATATAGANAIPKAGAGGTLAIGWIPVGTATGTVAAGDDSRLTNSRAPTGAAGGDLAGSYPNPTVTASAGLKALGGVVVTTSNSNGPVAGNFLVAATTTGAGWASLNTMLAAQTVDLTLNSSTPYKITSLKDPTNPQDAATKAYADSIGISGLVAGTGLTKTGSTVNVIANADGSIVANADDIQVGVITDAQHGTRAGGTLHALASGSQSGFLSTSDFTKLAGIASGADVTLTTLAAVSATVTINNQRVAGVLDPLNAQDVATKAYVDAVASGLDVKASCRLATTAVVGSSFSISNGGTISGTPLVVDTITVAVNDRILVKDGYSGANHAFDGIYTVTTPGTGSNGTWVRATDANTSAKITSGLFTFISEGALNATSGWVLATPDPITMNSTALTFSQFTGAGLINAGAGLTKTGNTLNVIANADGSIVANADDIQVGVITDTQHGTRAGGTTHAEATLSVAGFLSAVDKTFIGNILSGTGVVPSSVQTSSTQGSNLTQAARADHAHAHGVQAADGTMHVATSATQQGFYPVADWQKLALIDPASDTQAFASVAMTTNVSPLSGTGTFDGVAIGVNGSILLTGQSLQQQNGLWSVQSGTWTRPPEFDVTRVYKAGKRVYISSGTFALQSFVLASSASPSGFSGWTLERTSAYQLRTTTGNVSLSTATTPSTGAVLTASSGTAAAWSAPTIPFATLNSILAAASADITLNSTTPVKITALKDPTSPQDAATKAYADSIGISGLVAGTGLTKSGSTVNVIANADGSIVANADDIQVGVISDTQHGSRGGAALHALATASVNGFLSNTDFQKLAALTFGSTSGTYTQGNDTRLSDARTPTAHSASHKHGGSDEVSTATPAANAIPKADASNKLAIGWMPTGTAINTLALGDDTRFTNARTPTTHAASHQHGGSDEIATATAGINAIPKADGTGKLAYGWLPVGTAISTVAAGNDARFTDARTPTGAAGGDLSGSYPNPTHGNLAASATLYHGLATTSFPGFLSAADKTKLDSVTSGADPTIATLGAISADLQLGVTTTLGAAQIVNVKDPTVAQAVATKNYVDGQAVTAGNGIQKTGLVLSVANADNSINVAAGGISARLADPSLTTATAGMRVRIADGSLQTTASGLAAQLANASLQVSGSGLSVKPDTGLQVSASGLQVKLADLSLALSASGLAVGTITDAQHGARGNGTLHSVADASNAGFLSAALFTKLTALDAALPSALVVGGANTKGVSTLYSAADHLHALPAFGSAASTFTEGNDTRLSNDRTASGLRNATGIVAVSSGVAPAMGQILIADSPTSASWQSVGMMNGPVTATTSLTGTTEVAIPMLRLAIPANQMKAGHTLRWTLALFQTAFASGTVTFKIRCGPLGTVADPLVQTMVFGASTTQAVTQMVSITMQMLSVASGLNIQAVATALKTTAFGIGGASTTSVATTTASTFGPTTTQLNYWTVTYTASVAGLTYLMTQAIGEILEL